MSEPNPTLNEWNYHEDPRWSIRQVGPDEFVPVHDDEPLNVSFPTLQGAAYWVENI